MAVMAVCSHQANRRFGARKSGSAGTPAGAQGLRVLRGDANSCAFFSRLELVLDFMAQAFHGFCPWRVLRMNKQDRKSTRLNSSHGYISYAVFCLKKKKIN